MTLGPIGLHGGGDALERGAGVLHGEIGPFSGGGRGEHDDPPRRR